MGKYREVDNLLIEMSSRGLTGKEMSRKLNMDYSTIHKKLRRLNINLPNKHNALKFNNRVFDNIDTEEKAYWLGFLYADGSISSTNNTVELSLKGDDINHLEKYRKFLQLQRGVSLNTITLNGKKFNRCRCIVTDKYFHKRLCDLGCFPKKSLTLKFPNMSIFKDKKLIYDFIRGYIDGDGCISYTSTGRSVLEIIGTKEFLGGIKEIFPEVFSKVSLKDKRHPNSNTYTLSCACDKSDYILEILYGGANIYLDRKYNRFCRLIR